LTWMSAVHRIARHESFSMKYVLWPRRLERRSGMAVSDKKTDARTEEKRGGHDEQDRGDTVARSQDRKVEHWIQP
jgi:hypothetical protein